LEGASRPPDTCLLYHIECGLSVPRVGQLLWPRLDIPYSVSWTPLVARLQVRGVAVCLEGGKRAAPHLAGHLSQPSAVFTGYQSMHRRSTEPFGSSSPAHWGSGCLLPGTSRNVASGGPSAITLRTGVVTVETVAAPLWIAKKRRMNLFALLVGRVLVPTPRCASGQRLLGRRPMPSCSPRLLHGRKSSPMGGHGASGPVEFPPSKPRPPAPEATLYVVPPSTTSEVWPVATCRC
jgi:hypothetical protein